MRKFRSKVRNVRKDKRVFSATVKRTHKKNLLSRNPMRGGIRL